MIRRSPHALIRTSMTRVRCRLIWYWNAHEFAFPACRSGLPEIASGTYLAPLILSTLNRAGCNLREDDALLIGQKIVSKAENRFDDLEAVHVSLRA